MLQLKTHTVSNEIERAYAMATSLEHRKKFAQFFTPFPIARLMAKWLLGNNELHAVLEPAFGLGIFSRVLLEARKDLIIKGFEIDQNIYDKARDVFGGIRNVDIMLQDYMYNDWEHKYDGIICNPPYFKFHDYDNKNVLKEIEKRLSFKLNGFTNLYTLFLLKSIYQLNPNGRAAYIVPSEFLNADYGKLVKSYLIKSGVLRHIIVVNFEQNVFEDALTTASILLCAKDEAEKKVQFNTIHSWSDLEKLEKNIKQYPSYLNNNQIFSLNELTPEIKWRSYYQKQNATKFKHLVPFSNYGKVVRGIATGANEYFGFNVSKAQEFDIKKEYLLPCICKAVDVKESFFTTAHFEVLREKDKTVYLLNATNTADIQITKYLQKGKDEAVHEKYLTSKRNPWYVLENRPPAPIWVSVFNRNGLRFIKNEANVSNLTTFHCIYPVQTNLFSTVSLDLLFAYLLTDTAKQIFEDNRREYGNGLQKFEPNDINKAQMLDLKLIDTDTERNILEYYYLYRESVLNEKPAENYVSEINKILIEYFTQCNNE
ncbi:MAG: class I SAM-dependent DNA methyltransferase [Saprospiraceae bacterium]